MIFIDKTKNVNFINRICNEEVDKFIQTVGNTSNHRRWKKAVINDIGIYYIYDYTPQSRNQTESGKEPDAIQKFIWAFKNDSNDFSGQQYQKALERAEKAFISLMHELGFSPDTVLICVPTSSQEKYQRRWKRFSMDVCRELGIVNGYPWVKVKGSSVPSHFGGGGFDNVTFDMARLKGKDVILFDDLVTSGWTMRRTSEALEKAGANVVAHVALAKTVD